MRNLQHELEVLIFIFACVSDASACKSFECATYYLMIYTFFNMLNHGSILSVIDEVFELKNAL